MSLLRFTTTSDAAHHNRQPSLNGKGIVDIGRSDHDMHPGIKDGRGARPAGAQEVLVRTKPIIQSCLPCSSYRTTSPSTYGGIPTALFYFIITSSGLQLASSGFIASLRRGREPVLYHR